MSTRSPIIVKEPLLFFCLMATAVILAEIAGLGALSRPHGPFIAVIQHMIIIGLLSVWVYYSHGRRDNRFALLLLVTTAATGPFGAGICFLAAIVYMACCGDLNAPPCKWIDDFFSYEEIRESDRVHERVVFGLDNISDSNIEPFQDILAGGTVLQKQMAIAKITQHFQPRFAPLLLKAVQDSNAAVRVQAATGLAKIEHDFMMKYLHNEKRYKSAADNDPDQLQIAELCDNYAHAGILDEDGCSALRTKAIAIYETYLAHRQDPERQLILARLYLRQKQPEQTRLLLADSVESGDTTPAGLLWYMEALFSLKRLAQLRQVAKHYSHLLKNFDGYKSPGETRDALDAWGLAGEVAYAA